MPLNPISVTMIAL